MIRLILARHGEVRSDSPGRYWGYTDIPLSAEGIRQAKRLCHCLAKDKIGVIYSSDLRRALDTATIIASLRQIPVVSCWELREINFGQCEGMTFDEVREYCPEAERLWWGTDPELSFPGGESLKAFAERIDRFAIKLSSHSPDDTVLIVAHSGSLRVLICRLTGLDLCHWWQIRLDSASLSVVETFEPGAILCRLNDISHLKGGKK